MLKKILFWLSNSRLFSLPMSIMSWLVAFVFAIKNNGNIINGLVALVGLCFAQLATNLFDDYIDYKLLKKNDNFINNKTKTKCPYLINGKATIQELLLVVCIYCMISFLIGVYLAVSCGLMVVLLAIIGGFIVLTYAWWSTYGFGELAVGIAFGPLFFEGVYYVMCKSFSLELFYISLAVVVFTIGLLYSNAFLDYDIDKATNKKTICCRLGDKRIALKLFILLYGVGYILCLYLSIKYLNCLYLIPLLTVIFAINTYRSYSLYVKNPEIVKVSYLDYPLGNWNKIKNTHTASFYLRLLQSRNLMVWFSIFMIIAILFK